MTTRIPAFTRANERRQLVRAIHVLVIELENKVVRPEPVLSRPTISAWRWGDKDVIVLDIHLDAHVRGAFAAPDFPLGDLVPVGAERIDGDVHIGGQGIARCGYWRCLMTRPLHIEERTARIAASQNGVAGYGYSPFFHHSLQNLRPRQLRRRAALLIATPCAADEQAPPIAGFGRGRIAHLDEGSSSLVMIFIAAAIDAIDCRRAFYL